MTSPLRLLPKPRATRCYTGNLAVHALATWRAKNNAQLVSVRPGRPAQALPTR